MKSILFIAFLAIASVGCHGPEQSTDSDMSTPSGMNSDTMSSSMSTDTMSSSMGTTSDTTMPTPVDTTGGVQTDSTMNR